MNPSNPSDTNVYWFVNGEPLTTTNSLGQTIMIRANGKDGEKGDDGISPQLRITDEGFWQISIDRGIVWNYIYTSDGKAISATGPKGDKGDQGDKGDKGDQGDQGDKGDKGDPGVNATNMFKEIRPIVGDDGITLKEVTFVLNNGWAFTIPAYSSK